MIIESYSKGESQSDYQVSNVCDDINCGRGQFDSKCFCKLKLFIIRPFTVQFLM